MPRATEHLLLALLEEESGSGVLSGLGMTKPRTEELVESLLGSLGDQVPSGWVLCRP